MKMREIPATLGNCHQFLELADNHLTGRVPRLSAGPLALLMSRTMRLTKKFILNLGIRPISRGLRLGNNNFNGSIPRTLGRIRELSLIDLSGNSLTGPVPDELSLCRKLTHVDLDNNIISWPIPPWLGSLLNLGELEISNNKFEGPIPPEIFKGSKLLVLSLGDNALNGTFSDGIGNLASLNILMWGQDHMIKIKRLLVLELLFTRVWRLRNGI
ncbi:hypothetical protein MLD38_038256 [Melastoma candidum]|uniref:Uncharacterized protein n=1 Tax=Melastoma candidum TaxID=119954 RepID=A0ACB9KYM8_9MYRT|nr:hypothetical protein MLD38_038256 [Melastoma candidum]